MAVSPQFPDVRRPGWSNLRQRELAAAVAVAICTLDRHWNHGGTSTTALTRDTGRSFFIKFANSFAPREPLAGGLCGTYPATFEITSHSCICESNPGIL